MSSTNSHENQENNIQMFKQRDKWAEKRIKTLSHRIKEGEFELSLAGTYKNRRAWILLQNPIRIERKEKLEKFQQLWIDYRDNPTEEKSEQLLDFIRQNNIAWELI
jgi:uncharacterized protein YecT (DUF1311 family)